MTVTLLIAWNLALSTLSEAAIYNIALHDQYRAGEKVSTNTAKVEQKNPNKSRY
jgi:hypothetical protein